MKAYGLQLYSVRDTAEKDLLGTIRSVASLGYQGMEFAGFFGHTADEVRKTMDEAGVRAWGTHTGADALKKDALEETIAYHKTIGCPLLTVPGADLSTLQNLKAFADTVREAMPRLAQAGITLAYHNHYAEFVPNKDGVVIYDWLLENTEMKMEVDTFWAFYAGKDPVALLEKLGRRVAAIHLKDGMKNGDGKPLGQGVAPVSKVYAYAVAHKLPIIVESESLTPDGITEAKACMDCLKALEG